MDEVDFEAFMVLLVSSPGENGPLGILISLQFTKVSVPVLSEEIYA